MGDVAVGDVDVTQRTLNGSIGNNDAQNEKEHNYYMQLTLLIA